MYQTIFVKYSKTANLKKMAERIWGLEDSDLIKEIEIVELNDEPVASRGILVTCTGAGASLIDANIKDMNGVNSPPNYLEYTKITNVIASVEKTQ